MLRKARMKYSREAVDGFRMRGQDVTRLESFSDAVFGFALTLLVVSLEVPRSFADLIDAMRGFPAFAVCFAMLAMLWNSHYKFSRRYGLDDGTTRFLTCVLLFIVLVYVYPLKFLFNLSINDMIFGNSAAVPVIKEGDLPMLLTIYGLGFAGVYLALTLLYLHAWRLRDALELSEIEKLDTRFGIYRLSSVVVLGLLAAGLALIRSFSAWAGLSYLLLFPILRGFRMIHQRRRATLIAGRRNLELYNAPAHAAQRNCRTGASPAAFVRRLCQTLNPSESAFHRNALQSEL